MQMIMLRTASLALLSLIAGCGSQTPACGVSAPVTAVSPAAATADSADRAPGNQQQFLATSSPAAAGPGCAAPQNIAALRPNRTASDALHIRISSAADATNGLATCLGPTTGAATVTAHIGAGSSQTLATASLTCK